MSRPQHEPEDRVAALAAAMARAVREMEDAEDVRDADEAWEQGGKPIPLADLEAEFGQG
jgi:hypothetical protein